MNYDNNEIFEYVTRTDMGIEPLLTVRDVEPSPVLDNQTSRNQDLQIPTVRNIPEEANSKKRLLEPQIKAKRTKTCIKCR